MALPGFNCLVTAATGASATYSSVNGIKNFSIADSRDLLDITDFADGNTHARLAALRDVKVTLSGDYENFGTTTAGWNNILSGYNTGTAIALQVFLNSTTTSFAPTQGFAYVLQVENITYNAAVDGKVEVNVSTAIDATAGSAIFVL